MKSSFSLILFFLYSLNCQCQGTVVKIPMGTRGVLSGVLEVPPAAGKMPVVLIIAGSGPTDHDGNQSGIQNNCLKMMADSFSRHGIASLRFDKRGVGLSDRGTDSYKEIEFSHFVSDACRWIDFLRDDGRFSHITIAGHSEGAAIGMVAAQKRPVSAFISVAGPGRPMDVVLKEQLAGFVPDARTIVYGIIDKLKQGDTVGNIPPLLAPLFHTSIQPFLISLFRLDPTAEFSRLAMPCLVVQGTTDIQVSVEDAKGLAAANPKAELRIIPNMNHVLKDCDHRDKKRQMEDIYSSPSLPLNAEFSRTIIDFVVGL